MKTKKKIEIYSFLGRKHLFLVYFRIFQVHFRMIGHHKKQDRLCV